MRQFIRNYRTLTNATYRIITNLLLPAALAAAALLTTALQLYTLTLTAYLLMAVAEVAGDYLGFGCICKKNMFGMDFLKTAHGGIRSFEDALLADLFVRAVRTVCFVFITALPWGSVVSGWTIFDIAAYTAIISVVSLNVTRYFDTAQHIWLAAMLFCALEAAGAAALFLFNASVKWLAFLLAAVLLLTIVLTQYHMLVRIRQSYQDRE